MMIVYDRQTKKLLSFAGQVFDNGQWREPTLEEIYPNTDRSKWGVVYVRDATKYVATLDELQLKVDENGTPVGIERKRIPKIHLTTDAVDTDGDGLPELPADGQSHTTIRAEIKTHQGQLVTEELSLEFRTTGGTLSARKVTTTTGQASIELTSSIETIQITVTVSAEGFTEASLSFEFMPPNG